VCSFIFKSFISDKNYWVTVNNIIKFKNENELNINISWKKFFNLYNKKYKDWDKDEDEVNYLYKVLLLKVLIN